MAILIPPPVKGQNSIFLWQEALAEAMKSNDKEICFSPGVYEFFPEGCSQRYCYFSNNDEGVKTICLDLVNLSDIKIIGDNTQLFFHGRISPIVADNCQNLAISNLSIDFEDSFVSDADVVEVDGDVTYLKISGKHFVRDGKIIFTDDFYNNLSGRIHVYSYDTEKKEVIWQKGANCTIFNSNVVVKDNLVGVTGLVGKIKSDALILKHEARLCPGVVFNNCKDVVVNNVTIHHAAGMGLLAQVCENVALEGVKVAPNNRRCSASDDALHIMECRGKIKLNKCQLSGTLDDALNVHGMYFKLKLREPGWKYYYLKAGHFQQQGIFAAHTGDTVELLKSDTLKPYGTIKLTDTWQINKSQIFVEFDESTLPKEYEFGDVARILDAANASLEITNCSFASLNGRGVLASGLKNVVIKDNYFHCAGAGVFVSGDGRYWYESGPVENMEISNNTFNNCCYNSNGATRETIAVFPEIHKFVPNFFSHGNFSITNNKIITNKRCLIAFTSVKEATVKGNSFILDNTYTFNPPATVAYSFTTKDFPSVAYQYCDKVVCENNENFWV